MSEKVEEPDISKARICVITGAAVTAQPDPVGYVDVAPVWAEVRPLAETPAGVYPRPTYVPIYHGMQVGTVDELVAMYREGLLRAAKHIATGPLGPCRWAEEPIKECRSVRSVRAEQDAFEFVDWTHGPDVVAYLRRAVAGLHAKWLPEGVERASVYSAFEDKQLDAAITTLQTIQADLQRHKMQQAVNQIVGTLVAVDGLTRTVLLDAIKVYRNYMGVNPTHVRLSEAEMSTVEGWNGVTGMRKGDEMVCGLKIVIHPLGFRLK